MAEHMDDKALIKDIQIRIDAINEACKLVDRNNATFYNTGLSGFPKKVK